MGEAMMECRYCKTSNSEEDHRCRRCGRRLHTASARVAPDNYPVSVGSAAPALQTATAPAEPRPPLVRDRGARHNAALQGSLFAIREAQKIVAISGESLSTPRTRRRCAETDPSRQRTEPANARRTSAAADQGCFEFVQNAPQSTRKLKTEVEAVIFCGAPVASATHRMLAAAIDVSMILMALSGFLFIFHVGGGQIVFDKVSLPVYLLIPPVLLLLYELLWCVGGCDSPGMMWTGLRVVNFDGRLPSYRQRLLRLAGGCLGILSAGLGLLWSLVDEESLTWHDHISKTFPTLEESISPPGI